MIEMQELTGALARFVNTPVLVIGDLMVDEYLWGHVERISPEAPVQVVDVVSEESLLGGAGNVVKNLVSLGANVSVSSVVDDGETGALIMEQLLELGADTGGIFREPDKVSSRKTRILSHDQHQQILRIDRETLHPISSASEERIAAFVKDCADSFDVIIISDYMKGVLTEQLLKKIIEMIRKSGKPVIVDPKGGDYGKYANATVITPNRSEAETVLNMKITDEKTLQEAGEGLLSNLHTDAILITLGRDGMALFKRSLPGKYMHIPAVEKTVYDVTGAGDTVISVFGLGIAAGLDLSRAMEIANIAAGIVVGKIGTATVTIQEIVDDLLQSELYHSSKIVDLPNLVAAAEDRRNDGKRIVFTNGCFDILHVGHIAFLRQAKQLGDILIVGLNSDDSVKRLKGPDRPIIPMKERAAILSSLSCIDYITVFEEDTPIELIGAVKPDILVKGDDYSKEEVVGKDSVESYGGRVELIKLVEGVSTSSIIERIMKNSTESETEE